MRFASQPQGLQNVGFLQLVSLVLKPFQKEQFYSLKSNNNLPLTVGLAISPLSFCSSDILDRVRAVTSFRGEYASMDRRSLL